MVLKSFYNAEEPPNIFTINGKKRTLTDRQTIWREWTKGAKMDDSTGSCKRLKLEPTKDQVEDVNKQEEPSVEAPKPSSKNINKKRKRDATDEEPLHSEVSNKEKYEVERVGPRLHSGEAGPPLHPYLKTRAKTDRGEGGSLEITSSNSKVSTKEEEEAERVGSSLHSHLQTKAEADEEEINTKGHPSSSSEDKDEAGRVGPLSHYGIEAAETLSLHHHLQTGSEASGEMNSKNTTSDSKVTTKEEEEAESVKSPLHPHLQTEGESEEEELNKKDPPPSDKDEDEPEEESLLQQRHRKEILAK